MPELADNFVAIVSEQMAGDPMDEQIVWTNLTQLEIADRLEKTGTPVSAGTVKHLLDEFGFRKRKAQKSLPMGSSEFRNEQFENIARLKSEFLAAELPVISVDTKKKEMLGNFWRPGTLYTTQVVKTYDHDFGSASQGFAIPYGLYDLARNVAHITLGTSHDTSQFACDSIYQWWMRHGRWQYWKADSLLLLCDCGGNNNCRHYIFKEDLCKLATKMNLEIRVAHYPPYTSKYNPIEHRVFPHITRACQGVILHTLDVGVTRDSRECYHQENNELGAC